MKPRPVALSLAAVVVCALGLAYSMRAAGAVYAFSPQLKLDNRAALAPVIGLMERYLNEVDSSLASASHGMIAHNISGMYGSGFLRANLVGNDLDYFANVHLGKLPSAGLSSSQLAEAILDRMDVYRHAALRVAEQQRSAELALHHFMTTLPPGKLRDDAPTRRDLTASIGHALAGEAYAVGVLFRDASVVSMLDATSLYAPLVTNLQFYSNQVDQAPGTFAGIRGISLQLYFSVDLEAAPSTFSIATLTPSRNASQLWQQAMSGVFASREGAEAFQAQELGRQAIGVKRITYAQGFLTAMAFEQHVRRYPIKFLKRLHAYRDALLPVLPPSFVRRTDALLAEGLRGDAALYADQINALADSLQALAEQPALLRMFTQSGDVQRVLQFLRTAHATLAHKQLGELESLLLTSKGALERLDAASTLPNAAAAAAFRGAAREVVGVGLELVRKLSVSDEQMDQVLAAGQTFMAEMGYRLVRSYVDSTGQIKVASEDLACGDRREGLREEIERELRPLYGERFMGFNVNAASSEQTKTLPKPYLYYVRCAGDARTDQLFEARRQALRSDDFGRLVRSGA